MKKEKLTEEQIRELKENTQRKLSFTSEELTELSKPPRYSVAPPKPLTREELDEILSQKWPKEGWFSEEAARFQKDVPYIPTKNAGRKKIRELKSNS